MKKKFISLLLLAVLVCSMVSPAYAKTFYGDSSWNVTFTQDKEMVSSFKTSDLDDVILGMQPGDNAIITLSLKNGHSVTTNWYMTNKVLDSLEDDSLTASGGAYTYRLVYTGHDGTENVLFDSDTVGGEHVSQAGEGLNEATDALKDYFYLDTLAFGESGSITLEVALDGETQGNDYQDTLADLQMNFAVELNETAPSTNTTTSPRPSTGKTAPVYTGDETDLLPFIIAAAVSGILLLVFAVYSLKSRKQQKRGEQ